MHSIHSSVRNRRSSWCFCSCWESLERCTGLSTIKGFRENTAITIYLFIFIYFGEKNKPLFSDFILCLQEIKKASRKQHIEQHKPLTMCKKNKTCRKFEMNWMMNDLDAESLKMCLHRPQRNTELAMQRIGGITTSREDGDLTWPLSDVQLLHLNLKISETWRATARSRQGHGNWGEFRTCEQPCSTAN